MLERMQETKRYYEEVCEQLMLVIAEGKPIGKSYYRSYDLLAMVT